MGVEIPLFRLATDRIKLSYNKLVTNGLLRESLLNIDSYRFLSRNNTGHPANKGLDWILIAGGAGVTFGLEAGQLLTASPFARHLAQTISDLLGRIS